MWVWAAWYPISLSLGIVPWCPLGNQPLTLLSGWHLLNQMSHPPVLKRMMTPEAKSIRHSFPGMWNPAGRWEEVKLSTSVLSPTEPSYWFLPQIPRTAESSHTSLHWSLSGYGSHFYCLQRNLNGIRERSCFNWRNSIRKEVRFKSSAVSRLGYLGPSYARCTLSNKQKESSF